MTERHDDLLAGWRTPTAPPGLQQRALAAARDSRVVPIRRRIEDRIWESRGLRAAWLAAASILLGLNLLAPGTSAHRIDKQTPVVAATPMEDLDIGTEIPPHHTNVPTLGDTGRIAIALLADPCLDPSTEGDCT